MSTDGARPVLVLHVLDVLRPSGAETTLAVAGDRWAALGVEADVLATGAEVGSYAPELRAAGYRTGRIPLEPFPTFVRRFRRLLVDEGYDVVHNHLERANAYVDAVARSAGVGVVQSLHGLWDFTGALRVERTLMRAAMRAMGVRFVAVSEAVAANERERFANPTTVITNWFDDRTFTLRTPALRAAARDALELPPDARVVATVGNCSSIKNHTALLHALAQLRGTSPPRWGRVGAPVLYLHAGTGADAAAEQALATELGLAECVRFLGFAPAVRVLHAADAYVMPSLHEGQGIAAIEAVAAGVPTLLADSPGLRTLADLDLPLRWAAPTPDGLAEGLRRILTSPPAAADLAAASVAVTARFAPARPLTAFSALYRELAHGEGRGA